MVDSLRLRETTTDTSLRATTGEAGLRSDNYVAPINTTSTAVISAKVASYTEDSKEWGLQVDWEAEALPDASTPSSGNINIAEIQIRYAWMVILSCGTMGISWHCTTQPTLECPQRYTLVCVLTHNLATGFTTVCSFDTLILML